MSTEPKPQRAPREPRDRRPPQPQQSHSQSQQQAHGPRRHPRQQGGRRQPHVAAPAASRTATTEPTDAAAAASASAAGAAATALPPLPDLPDLPDVGKLEVNRSAAEEQSEPELAEPEHSCPVCADRIYILAAGACNHGVCHRCALRLRVLCGDNHCPVCRAELAKVRFALLLTYPASTAARAGVQPPLRFQVVFKYFPTISALTFPPPDPHY